MDIASIPNPAAAEAAATAVVVQQIARDRIVPSPFNRTKLGNLAELAESVAKHGVLQNLLVRPAADEGMYELICGERRWRAAELAGVATLPCIVHDWDDREVIDAQISENLHRKDLSALDEAESYQLALDHGHTIESLAAKIAKPESSIRARLSLLRLSPVVRKALEDEKLTASHALVIAGLGDHKMQDSALDTYYKGNVLDWEGAKAITEPLTVRQLKLFIAKNFLLRLDGAPFDRDDATLVPEAGACAGCPHRTGNQRELFADVKSADVCTNPPCFEKKKRAGWDAKAAEAQRQGLRVLSDKEARRVFRDGATTTKHDAPYVDPKEELPYDLQEATGKKTWSSLLGKDLPAKVLGRDGTGAARELVDRNAALERAKATGKLPDEKKGAATRKTKAQQVDWQEQQRRDAEKRELNSRAARIALGEIVAKVPDHLDSQKKELALWRWIARATVTVTDDQDQMLVGRRRGLTGAKTDRYRGWEPVLQAEAEKMKELPDLVAFVVELLAANGAVPWHGGTKVGDAIDGAAELLGVDLKAARATAAAEMKAEKKEAEAKTATEEAAPAKSTKKKGGKK